MIVRAALIAFGIYVITEYIYPLITKAIVNTGNAFGLLAGAGFIAVGIFMRPLQALLNDLWQAPVGKMFLAMLCALTIAFAALFLLTLVRTVCFGAESANGQTTVIVLGCRVNGTEPSVALQKRTHVAAQYLKKHPDAVAILSGGQGPDEGISEGACMKRMMLEKGIDEERLLVEDKSTSTDENFAFSKRIIEERGLSKDVAVATHDYHQLRASLIAEKNGLFPAPLSVPSARWTRATFFTREVFGIWVQWIKR